MSIQDGQTVNMQGDKDDSLDDSDRIDDDVLRDVDAFTSSDEEDEMGFMQDGRLSFAPVTYDVTSMDGPGPNSPMQMSLKAISVGASIRMLKSVGPAASASVLSKMSKVTRTEVKLIQ